jgi:hypothetical protein
MLFDEEVRFWRQTQMGEQYEAYKLARGLDHGDISYVETLLQQDAQLMYPGTFQNLISDANQQRQNPNADQLQQGYDQNGLPVVNIIDSNNPYNNVQVQTPGQTQDGSVNDQAPPPPPPAPEYYNPGQAQYPQQPQYPEQPQYPMDQSQYPPPPQGYYQPQPREYYPGQCGAQTAVGAVVGALIGGALTGGRSRGVGVFGGAVVGGAIANNGCP